MATRPERTESSGNVYADLGFVDPELERAKAELAREIRSYIDLRGMTQKEAALRLGIDQSDVSKITRGRLGGYSLDRLVTLLTRLSLDVDIRLRPTTSAGLNGRVLVDRGNAVQEEAPAELDATEVVVAVR